MFAAALTRRAYLPCGSVLYSVRLGCTRRGARSTAAPLHLERSVSRLPNCLNSGEGVSRDVSDPRYSCTRASGPTTPPPCTSSSCVRGADVSRGWMGIYEDFAPRKYPVTVFASEREKERGSDERTRVQGGEGKGRKREPCRRAARY